MTHTPRVIDYEGSKYSTEFWTPQREYEDRAERIAIQALLPPRGNRLIDIGAGAGRLGDMYLGYDEVILMDYARSTVIEARDRWQHDRRFKFVAADLYQLPCVDGAFDTVVMIRVIHHIVDVTRALGNIAAALKPGGAFVFEFANKRNLKSIARYALKRQRWSPCDRSPVEFVELNFDFHPDWMKTQLRHAGFTIKSTRAVSTFRLGVLKRLFGAKHLAAIDGALQRPLASLAISPSMFVLSTPHPPTPSPNDRSAKRVVERGGATTPPSLENRFLFSGEGGRGDEVLFACPFCREPLPTEPSNDELRCGNGHRWSTRDGIFDFKTPVTR